MSSPFLVIVCGSPAWAGIDRSVGRERGKSLGFPRVGGDRPAPSAPMPLTLPVPPRGRG